MKKELDEILCKDFPGIFRDRHGDMRVTCMYWGLEIEDGWEKLLRKMCEQLAWIEEKTGVQVIATQVKEKFGGLRFYANRIFPEDISVENKDMIDGIINIIIHHAEEEARQTCEICGKAGELNATPESWWRTLCEEHANAFGYTKICYERV